MNPAARLSAALLLGLVLWLPSLSACMRGAIDLPEAAIRFLVAFGLARLAVAFLHRMLATYSATAHHHDHHGHESTTDDGVASPAGLS